MVSTKQLNAKQIIHPFLTYLPTLNLCFLSESEYLCLHVLYLKCSQVSTSTNNRKKKKVSMAEDRFSQIENTESLCFLCLKKADQLCKKCEIPYCSQEHFNVHYDEKIDYCYPFRVMQRPEVSFCFSLTIITKLLTRSDNEF